MVWCRVPGGGALVPSVKGGARALGVVVPVPRCASMNELLFSVGKAVFHHDLLVREVRRLYLPTL